MEDAGLSRRESVVNSDGLTISIYRQITNFSFILPNAQHTLLKAGALSESMRKRYAARHYSAFFDLDMCTTSASSSQATCSQRKGRGQSQPATFELSTKGITAYVIWARQNSNQVDLL